MLLALYKVTEDLYSEYSLNINFLNFYVKQRFAL
jgi:hypothetical protein